MAIVSNPSKSVNVHRHQVDDLTDGRGLSGCIWHFKQLNTAYSLIYFWYTLTPKNWELHFMTSLWRYVGHRSLYERFQQTVGIPMGKNCSPLLADIFLYSYEAGFIQSLLSTGKKHLASRFNLTYRHIDDILSINNPEFENYLCQMYPAELEIKDNTESTTSASYLDLLLSIGRDVNFTLPSTTSEMSSISTSQTFRSWVAIFHHRRPMACLSLNLYDTPGLAPRMNVLFWGPGDFLENYSNRDTLWNAWNRHSGSFMVDTGILLSNME